MSMGSQRPARRSNGPHRSSVLLGAVIAVLSVTVVPGCGKTSYTEQEHLERAIRFQKQGDLASSVIELKNVLQQDPDNAEARWRLGRIYLKQGDMDDARHHLERARQLGWTAADAKAASSSSIDRAAAYLDDKDYRQALEAAKQAVKEDEKAAYPHILLGRALMGAGRVEEAVQVLEKALALDPGNRAATNDLAVIAVMRGDIPAVRGYYRTALEERPENTDLLLDFANFEASKGDPSRANELVQRAIQAHPEALRPRVILARYYLNVDRPEDALEALAPINQRYADDPARLEVYGRAQLAAARLDPAIDTFRKLVRVSSERASAFYQLGVALRRAGRRSEAVEAFAGAVKADQGHVPSIEALADMALSAGETDKAEALASRLEKLDGGAQPARILHGRLALRRGDLEAATSSLASAYRARPTEATALLVYRAYRQADREAEAVQLLASHVARSPNDDRVRLMLGGLLLEQGDYKGAASHLQTLRKRHPRNLAVANNLAYAMHRLGDPRAEEVARAGHRLRPDDPRMQDTLGVILLDSGKTREALKLLESAHAGLPDNPSVTYHLVRAQVRSEQLKEARHSLKQLLAGDEQFPERHDARALLKRLE